MATRKDNIRLTENMLRNVVRNTIKEALTEKLEVAKDSEAEEICRSLFNKLHIEKQHNDRLSAKNKERVLTVTEYTKYGTITVNIDTSMPNDVVRFHGGWTEYDKRIDITFNEASLTKYNEFRNALFHEMTHALDNGHFNIYTGNYNVELYSALRNANNNPLQAIIYRLWTPTERNAYTTYAYQRDLKPLKDYFNYLEQLIDTVDKNPEQYANGRFWVNHIAPLLLGRKYGSEDKWPLVKEQFIKKSRMLLERFKKKAMQRYRQHYNDHGEEYQPDMNDVKYQAVNYDIIKGLTNIFPTNIMFLVKHDQDFQDWVESRKQRNSRLTNKVLKYVWDRELPKMINLFAEEPSYYDDELAWAKRHGYYNG